MFEGNTSARQWLLIDASQVGFLRFATAKPSPRPRLENIRAVDISSMPTFTDALQQFERDTRIPLRGLECAMAIAGATSGETLSLVRSRWTITRSGLAAVFGRDAVIINDVAARAWATRSGSAAPDALRGARLPNLTEPGRYAMIMVDEGVNAAIVDVDRDGVTRILETEAGKLDFAPANETEQQLARALRGISPYLTWERMLQLERREPAWTQACPDLTETERMRIIGNVLGRFAINLMHTYACWNGVMLTGCRVGRVLDPSARAGFDASFSDRREFSRLISGTPVWRIEQREAVLIGTAERLAQNHSLEVRKAA